VVGRYATLLHDGHSLIRGGLEAMSTQNLTGLNGGNFAYYGTVKRHTKYKEKTSYTSIFENFCEKKQVNPKLDYRYASANVAAELPSIAKYDRQQPHDVNEAAWAFARDATRRHFACMNGSSKLPFFAVAENLDKTTSPGYPFNLQYPTKSAVLENPAFSEHLNTLWHDMTTTSPTKFIWTCSVKSEMRPEEKVEANKLRTFLAAPIDLTMCANRLCLDMNDKFYEMGQKQIGWSCVGMSKFNRGWHKLATRLGRFPQGFNLDGASYDASLMARLLYEIGQMRIDFGNYSKDDAQRMRHIYDNIINSMIVLSNGDVVMKSTGMPSGSSNTVVDNTMALFFILAYCWYQLAKGRKGFESYESFMEFVEAALYGDDNTFTVSPNCISWFNGKSVAIIALELGVRFETENNNWEPIPLIDLVFLGNKFSLYKDTYVPIPEMTKTLSSLAFGTACPDPRWHLMRAHALLMDSFFNKESHTFLKEYIHFIWQNYKEQLVDGDVNKVTTWQNIQSTFKTDDWIQRLYISHEKLEKPKSYEDEANKIGHPRFDSTTHQSLKMSGPIAKLKSAVRTGLKIEHGLQKAGNKALNTARNYGNSFVKKTNNQAKANHNNNPNPSQPKQRMRNGRRGPNNKRQRTTHSTFQTMTPHFKATKNGGVMIENREVLNSLDGGATWTVRYNQLINPTNILMFPWLAGIATKFDKYNIKKLDFRLVTRMGTAVTGTAAQGSVQTTIIYDSDDPVPTTYSSIMNSKYATECVIHKNHTLKFHPNAALFTEYYVAHSGGEQDLTAPGYAVISLQGLTATTTGVYSMVVDYAIEFTLPRVAPTAPLGVTGRKWYAVNSSYNTLGAASGFGANTTTTGSPIAVIQSIIANTWTCNFAGPGVYSVVYSIVWESVTTTATLNVSTAHAQVGPADYATKSISGGVSTIWTGRKTFSVPTANHLWSRNLFVSGPSDLNFDWTTLSDTAAVFSVDIQIISCGQFLSGGQILQAGATDIMNSKETDLIADITQKVRAALRSDKDESDDYTSTYHEVNKTGETVMKIRGYDEIYSRPNSSSSSSGSNKK